ncbi:MAG: hypothetical protein ACQKBV_00230 [Puniceicoccales bacterium]
MIIAIVLAGCGYNVRYAPINNPVTPQGAAVADSVAARGPVNPADVRIFFVQRPEKAYNELGIITIPTMQSAPNEEEIFNLFRQKAAEVGGDGVIILDTQTSINSYPGTAYADYWGIYYTETIRSQSIFRGLVIQFLE